mmetsp:Transcript_12083/g.25950  ORF Transcript_12083/g.25950 Transcript_12083/m.25950 type:complete len:167 (-) Transcript_12083:1194-1694(-)
MLKHLDERRIPSTQQHTQQHRHTGQAKAGNKIEPHQQSNAQGLQFLQHTSHTANTPSLRPPPHPASYVSHETLISTPIRTTTHNKLAIRASSRRARSTPYAVLSPSLYWFFFFMGVGVSSYLLMVSPISLPIWPVAFLAVAVRGVAMLVMRLPIASTSVGRSMEYP